LGVIDKDPAHGLGGGRNEVTAAVEPLVADQPQVGFVDEGGGVEGVAGGFGSHAYGGEFPQFVIEEREQICGGLAVTLLNGFEQAGHVGHKNVPLAVALCKSLRGHG